MLGLLPSFGLFGREVPHFQEVSGVHKHIKLSQGDCVEPSAWVVLCSGDRDPSEVVRSPREPLGMCCGHRPCLVQMDAALCVNVQFASQFVFACFVLLSIAQKGDE